MYTGNRLDPDTEAVQALTQDDSEILHQFLASLSKAIDAKDPGTGFHSMEVARIAEAIGWAMGLSGQEVRWLHTAGLLHDIGKIGIPQSVLSKPGPLSDEEWRLIFTHPVQGADIVRPVQEFGKPGSVADMVLHHHERWDGQGYPDELRGEAIPLGARIIAVADVVSTLMQDRPYRAGVGFDKAAEEIVRCSGTAFDPDVVEVFVSVRDDIEQLMASI